MKRTVELRSVGTPAEQAATLGQISRWLAEQVLPRLLPEPGGEAKP